MHIVIALAIIIALLLIGGLVLNLAVSLVYWLVVGLIVGAVARFVLPGRQNLSWLATALYGAAGGLIGGVLAERLFDWGTLGAFVLAVIVAALLIAAFAGSAGRRHDRVVE